MAEDGSTMGEEPGWAELLFTFAVAAALPIVIGLTVICSLVGLTLWAKALLLRRRAAGGAGQGRGQGQGQGQDSPSTREDRENAR